jgi:septal ring factor EnvC (AmiA/AmiB activator)
VTKGTVTSAITQTTVNNVLGLEGQARLNQFLQTLVATGNKISSFSTSATAASQSSNQLGSTTQQIASTSGNSANASQTTSEQTKNLAQQAQSFTSTQDVLKAIANQNANNAAILSSISSQFGNNASQNANLSSQLATLANQNSLMSQQAMQQSVIDGQNLQLQLMQTEQGTAALANLDEANSTLKGQSLSQALEFRSVIRSRMPLTLSK